MQRYCGKVAPSLSAQEASQQGLFKTARTGLGAGAGEVGVQVDLEDAPPLGAAGQRELQRLVHAVQHGRVQVARAVGGQHDRKVARLVARAEQRRVQRRAQALRVRSRLG